jgi:uncharacterized protein (DUF1330 family)
MQVRNAVMPTPDQARDFFSAPEQGPFVMVNLLRFKTRAEYPDGAEPELSGAEAYMRYGVAVAAMVEALGGRIIYSGAVTGLLLGEVDDLWDMVALAEYPSLNAMLEMTRHPDYARIAVHRDAGLAGQLNIRTLPRPA